MKSWKAIALIILSLMFSGCGKSQPDWLLTNEKNGNKIYVDAASVEKNGIVRSFKVLTDIAEERKLPSGEVFRSAISVDEIDCETNRTRSVRFTLYEKPDGEGRPIFSKEDPNEWVTIISGSGADKNREYVCK